MMPKVLTDLLGSKKAVAAIAAVLFTVLNSLGITALSEESLIMVVSTISIYVLGQSVADLGKEKSKVELSE